MLKSVPWKRGVNTAFEKNIKVMTKMLTSNSRKEFPPLLFIVTNNRIFYYEIKQRNAEEKVSTLISHFLTTVNSKVLGYQFLSMAYAAQVSSLEKAMTRNIRSIPSSIEVIVDIRSLPDKDVKGELHRVVRTEPNEVADISPIGSKIVDKKECPRLITNFDGDIEMMETSYE